VNDLGIHFANERDAAPVRDQPAIEVVSWRLMKASSGALHLATLRHGQADQVVARLTSAIAHINCTSRTLTTSSGRLYVLQGPPESRPVERQALRDGAAALGLSGAIDVSEKQWEQMR
jgi:hypothetical protein